MENAARNIPKSQGVALADAERERLRALIEGAGETEALKLLGIARQTLARCLAGLPVQRATAEYVARRIAESEADDAP